MSNHNLETPPARFLQEAQHHLISLDMRFKVIFFLSSHVTFPFQCLAYTGIIAAFETLNELSPLSPIPYRNSFIAEKLVLIAPRVK